MKRSKNHYPFSDTWLEKLSQCAGKAHVHYYDSNCPALAVRVTSSGQKAFKAFNRAGSPQFIHIAALGEISLEDARLRAQSILRSMHETGLTPAEQNAVEEQKKLDEKRLDSSLQEVLNHYTSVRVKPGRKRSILQKTADDMKREISRHFCDWLDKPLRLLGYEELDEIHETIIDASGPSVADRLIINIGTLIRHFEEKVGARLFDHNPARKVLRLDGHEPVVRRTHLPPSRFPAFFEALEKMDEDAADFLAISIFTGLRAESVKTLRWDLIKLHEKQLDLTKAKGRADESEALPLSNYVITILRRRKATAGEALYVFPHHLDVSKPLRYHDTYLDWLWVAGGGTIDRIPYQLKDRDGKLRFGKRGKPVMGKKRVLAGESSVCNQKGRPITHHDFRRTFCSVAAGAAGVDVFSAMLLSLHKIGDGATKVHSDYVQLEHLRPSLEKISDAILRLGKPSQPYGTPKISNVVLFAPRQNPPDKCSLSILPNRDESGINTG